MTVPARCPEDDALDRLQRVLDLGGYSSDPEWQEVPEALSTVREAMERLREEWMTDPETGESFRLKPGALLAEIQRLREKLDAAKRELREFEHVDGEPLYETAVVAASSFAFARHRAESAEAEVRQLREERDDLLRQRTELQNSVGGNVVIVDKLCEEKAEGWRRALAAEAEVRRLTEGLREAKWLIGAGLPHTMEWHDRADAWYTEARALLSASPSDGGEPWESFASSQGGIFNGPHPADEEPGGDGA